MEEIILGDKMNLNLNRDQLKKCLSILRNTLGDSKMNVLLEHFLFEVENGKLTIKSTNFQTASVWTVNTEVTENFSFTVPGNILIGLISSLGTEEISLEYDPKNLNIKLIAGSYEWETVSGNISDFPVIEIPPVLKEIKLPQNFSSLLKNVSFAISDDSKQIDMNSLCMDINKNSNKGLKLIATDRIRLSCANSEIETEEVLQFIIPKNSVLELIKLEPKVLLYNEEDTNKIYFKSQFDFGGELIFLTSLTNAKYPDIYAYLNDTFSEAKMASVNRNSFIDSLKRVKLISDKTKRVGSFKIDNSKMIISSLNNLNKCKESLSIESELKSSFECNIDFILDYLLTEVESKVNFKYIEKKCVIFDKENYRYVLSIK